MIKVSEVSSRFNLPDRTMRVWKNKGGWRGFLFQLAVEKYKEEVENSQSISSRDLFDMTGEVSPEEIRGQK